MMSRKRLKLTNVWVKSYLLTLRLRYLIPELRDLKCPAAFCSQWPTILLKVKLATFYGFWIFFLVCPKNSQFRFLEFFIFFRWTFACWGISRIFISRKSFWPIPSNRQILKIWRVIFRFFGLIVSYIFFDFLSNRQLHFFDFPSNRQLGENIAVY